MKKFTIIAILMLLKMTITAQEVVPLQLGNVWIYDNYPGVSRTTVVDTNVIIDNISYFKLLRESNQGNINYFSYVRLRQDGYYVVRRDTSYPAPNHELLYYKKNAIKGDSWAIPSRYNSSDTALYTIQDTLKKIVFGKETTVKYLTINEAGGLVILDTYWTEEFGRLSSSDFGWLLSSLRGCVIDGEVYGDTSFIVVGVEEDNLPSKFILSQNYPNPFNPTTKIEYEIPKGDYINLEVFNILGEQIKTLVSGYKQPGKYSIEFNAENLASGTYLYVMKATKFIGTKKMQLLR